MLERENENLQRRARPRRHPRRPGPSSPTWPSTSSSTGSRRRGSRDGDQWLARAEAGLTDSGQPSSEDACSGARGYLNYYFGNFARSGELAQAAMDAGVAIDDPVASGRAMDLGGYLLQLGDPLGTVPFLEDALAHARAADDQWGEIDILQKIGFCYLYADRYDDAERSFDAARDRGLCGNNPFFVAWQWNARIWIEHRRGHDVAAGASDAIAAADASGDLTTIAWAQHLRRARAAPPWLAPAGPRARRPCRATVIERGRLDAPALHARPRRLSADLWAGAGDPAGVMRVHSDYWRADHVTIAEAVAIEIVALGETLHGHPGAPRSVARLGTLGDPPAEPACTGRTGVALRRGGRHAGRRPRPGRRRLPHRPRDLARPSVRRADPRSARRARVGLGRRRQGRRPPAACSRSPPSPGASEGGPSPPTRSSGRHRRASAVIDTDAFRAGERSAAELTVDEAVAMVTRSRGPRLRPLVGWPSLTPTEHAVVALVAEGLSNPDIAERLFISRSTVKTHLNHAFSKLDITNPRNSRPPTRREMSS